MKTDVSLDAISRVYVAAAMDELGRARKSSGMRSSRDGEEGWFSTFNLTYTVVDK